MRLGENATKFGPEVALRSTLDEDAIVTESGRNRGLVRIFKEKRRVG